MSLGQQPLRPLFIGLYLGLAALAAGCADKTFNTADSGVLGDQTFTPDSPFVTPCQAGKDTDGDGIPDEVEGCGNPPVDTDADGLPDFQDTDSDNDGVPDKIEGTKDTDGDGIPDFQDNDSDDDGINDGDEDLNGDGLFGCCLTTCGEQRKGCPKVATDGCGLGQTCAAGKCDPPVAFLCSDGETDPLAKETYPGSADKDLPTFVCRKPGETGPQQGLKPMDFHKSKAGDWHIAIDQGANFGELLVAGAEAKDSAAAFGLPGPTQAVSGFLVTRQAGSTDGIALVTQMITDITDKLPDKTAVAQLSSGSPTISHDGYPTVVSTQLAITLSKPKRPSDVRNDLYAILLGKAVTNLPTQGYGPPVTEHLLRIQTLLRPDGRLIFMGGVAATAMANDVKQATAFHLDDFSNGSGLATAADADTIECDPFVIDAIPTADIIWVVDESQSMDDNRADVVNNAADFFSRAVLSGLDFRMAIAGVKDPTQPGVVVGKFCSRKSNKSDDDGGDDRFLTPSEQDIFKSCIQNPPYSEFSDEYGLAHAYEAVARHLPRAANDPSKVRPDAELVLIIATDEAPLELKNGTSYLGKDGMLGSGDTGDGVFSKGKCTLSSSTQTKLDAYLKPWVDLYTGKDATFGAEAKTTVHLIGGLCSSNCGNGIFFPGPEQGHGYRDLVKATGGIMADVCQKNLGASLQIMIDAITGAASPAVLQYVPISASLAVAIGGQQLQRSRVSGFDYAPASNSLVFLGIPINKGTQVVASYRRWVKQAQID